jgi:KDO2-lipid IV(A) lauroyltransferase
VRSVLAALLRAVAFAVASLPLRWLPWLGAAAGWWCGRVLGIRRAHVIDAMRAACVGDPPRAADGMYRALGVSLLEFLWLGGRGRRPLGELGALDASAEVAIEEASRLGRGIVLAGAHTGNWELAACAMAERVPVLVVAKRLSVGVLDAFARRTRARYGVSLAEPEGALGVAQQKLAAGGCVTLIIDQVPESVAHGVAVSFLGQPALASRAPAALAWRQRAPLLVVAARREPSGRHVLSVLQTLLPPSSASPPAADRAWIEEATRASTLSLERFVQAHPTEWLWLHRRWRLPAARRPAPCFPGTRPLHEGRHA